MTILQTKDLRKIYGAGETEVRALDGVDLTVEKGEFVAVVGTSGSGKSTLLHMLGGLDRPTSGSVVVDGRDLSTLKDEELTVFRRRKIGFVFQGNHLVPELTVQENILFPLALDDARPDWDFFREITRLLGLTGKLDALPHTLSGGAQQCTAIARALMTKPALLLADEPTSALDMAVQRQVVEEMLHVREAFGTAIIIVTHDIGVVSAMADSIVVLSNGRVMEYAAAKDVLENPQNDYTVKLLSAVPRLRREKA